MDIGVRELRETLSQQLAAVQEGHTVTITSHSRPVARLVPIEEKTVVERLRSAGLVVRPPDGSRLDRPEPVRASGPVSDFIDEQRR